MIYCENILLLIELKEQTTICRIKIIKIQTYIDYLRSYLDKRKHFFSFDMENENLFINRFFILNS